MSFVSDIVKFTPLGLGLRRFLHDTITFEDSKRVIADRIQNREKNFLGLVNQGIFGFTESPYSQLFRAAGYEFGDVESLVHKDGLEATLQKLLTDGVYLSYEEFKRGKEVIRGSSRFRFNESEFDNPLLAVHYQTQSSGSRSAGTRTTFDFSHLSDISYYRLPVLAVNDALDVPLGLWQPVLPAASGIGNVLTHWKAGKPVDRWFSPVDEKLVQASPQHRLAMRYILYSSRLWGAKLARPEFVALEDAVKVSRWMAHMKKERGGCCLKCAPGLAVKVCRAAVENGLDIRDTHFITCGEPLTPAKRQQIEATGARVTSSYAISEIGRIGCGCLESSEDDVHLCHDFVAVIQHQRRVEQAGISVNAFLFTPLLPSAPKIMLNVESDDYGVMEHRDCNCLFGQLGFKTHIRDIRSFAKLTGSGMTIIGTDLVRILEEVLPLKYGGASTDYQLLEEEDNAGQTRLSLVISPGVGVIDESAVKSTVLDELRRSKAKLSGKLAAGVWSQADTIRVKRMQPVSKMGKIWTLHLLRGENNTTPQD